MKNFPGIRVNNETDNTSEDYELSFWPPRLIPVFPVVTCRTIRMPIRLASYTATYFQSQSNLIINPVLCFKKDLILVTQSCN